ncbi:hypothetical protein [Kribbella sp. NPDC023855]|uniref:hypothetical protein n=1 Tax=Kribbella sp. NPDC023855 TaxID=3154698 RepID=UPI0033C07954
MTAPSRKTTEAAEATTAASEPAAETWPKTELTVEEMVDSLTGWDELAIEEQLKKPIDGMRSNYTVGRALIGVHRMRAGEKAAIAFKAAMEMPNGDVSKYFTKKTANDNDLLVPTEAGKEAGKR